MGEIEKVKIVKTKKTINNETNQIMTVIINDTIRGIVKTVNEENIKKEDIVSLLKENEQFILVYFK